MAAQLFDAVALTLFFEDANNMGLSHHTCPQLAVEGITEPEDFKEFDNDGMRAIKHKSCFNSIIFPAHSLVFFDPHVFSSRY
jgi:hypothetical protein